MPTYVVLGDCSDDVRRMYLVNARDKSHAGKVLNDGSTDPIDVVEVVEYISDNRAVAVEPSQEVLNAAHRHEYRRGIANPDRE